MSCVTRISLGSAGVRTYPRCRGTSLIRNCPPPQGHCRAPDTGLLKGPRGWQFRLSEVPLSHPVWDGCSSSSLAYAWGRGVLEGS